MRLALSHAIDRKTINDVVYFGLGKDSQAVTSPYSPWGRTTDEGKQLMEQWRTLGDRVRRRQGQPAADGAGLTKKDSEGFRLRPDGKRLSWVIITGSTPDSRAVDVLELVAENWKQIGIEATINSMDWNSGFWPKFSPASTTSPVGMPGPATTFQASPTVCSRSAARTGARRSRRRWFNTQGEKGNKPEAGDPMERMIEMYKQYAGGEQTEEGRNKWVLEAVKIHVS